MAKSMEEAKKELPSKKSLADVKRDLNKERDRLSPWLKWTHETTEDGKELTSWNPMIGVILDLTSKESKFPDHNGNKKLVYPIKLEFDGMEKTYDAPEVLKDLIVNSGIEFGDTIKIERVGELKATRYTVTKVK